MRTIWRKNRNNMPSNEKRFRSNDFIRSPQVLLIDENGENKGVVPIQEALALARATEMDLVEINPKNVPPIVKIIDYGQFKYEQDKKLHKQKVAQKKIDVKGVRLSVRISPHDSGLRIDQATKFLEKKHKLKIELILKGREKQHAEKGAEVINAFVAELEKNPNLKIFQEQNLTKQGGRFSIVLVNKK
jgi:translation initiation factor IF-3